MEWIGMEVGEDDVVQISYEITIIVQISIATNRTHEEVPMGGADVEAIIDHVYVGVVVVHIDHNVVVGEGGQSDALQYAANIVGVWLNVTLDQTGDYDAIILGLDREVIMVDTIRVIWRGSRDAAVSI